MRICLARNALLKFRRSYTRFYAVLKPSDRLGERLEVNIKMAKNTKDHSFGANEDS